MKMVVFIILFFFLSFLSLPTVVFVLDNDEMDITIAYNTNEEEVHKTLHCTACFKLNKEDDVFDNLQLPFQKVILKNLLLYDSILEEIYPPPP